ncbi:hypothetical protein M527_04275 [Sphingobium indicum IP26]|nr:hypothetical protein M527_04275 [Sphingobium indicum IP26]
MRIVAPLPCPPEVELFRQIGSGLRAQRRIGRAKSFTTGAMAGGARRDPA